MVNNYKITFIGEGATETLILDFSDTDIAMFNVYFESKFAYSKQNLLDDIDSDLIKTAILIEFYANTDNFEKISGIFSKLNKQLESINEVLIYKNDDLYCDLKNVINVSTQNSVRDSVFTLAIIEGV